MEFTVHIDDNDFLAFVEDDRDNDPKRKRRINFRRSLIPLICIGFLLLEFICLASLGRLSIIVENKSLIVFCGFLVAYSIYYYAGYRSRLRKGTMRSLKTVRESGRIPYEQDYTIMFDEDRMRIYGPSSEDRIPYSELLYVRSNDRYVFVGTRRTPIILPATCLNGMEKELLAFLNDKLPNAGF